MTAASRSSPFSSCLFSFLCVDAVAATLYPFAIAQSQKWYFAASESKGFKVTSVNHSEDVIIPARETQSDASVR